MCSAAALNCLTTPLAGPQLRVRKPAQEHAVWSVITWLGYLLPNCTTGGKVRECEGTQSDSLQGISKFWRRTPNQVFAFSQNRMAEF